MVHFHSCIPIPVGCDALINHVAFNGCDYFCTMRCRCEIIRFDPCTSAIHRYCTCREYDCICYDYRDCCFWASSRTDCGKIFKLDCSMQEIDCIPICEAVQYGLITGISYDCCKNLLIVSFPCTVISIDKVCRTTEILYFTRKYWIKDVLCVSPCMLLTVFRCHKPYLVVINSCGEEIGCYFSDAPSILQNLLFNPCMPNCHNVPFWAFVRKENCYPYLCHTDITFSDLGFTPYSCNFELCEACCCHTPPCPDCDPCKDIMESIALIETAMSHILNAEGEKIQKVLATTDDIHKIMCVNREVNKTIVNATHLEHTLYAKLSALCDCGLCDDICEDGCNCCCDD